jgi:hypothetical protein
MLQDCESEKGTWVKINPESTQDVTLLDNMSLMVCGKLLTVTRVGSVNVQEEWIARFGLEEIAE